MGEVGHTHAPIDQRYACINTALTNATILQTPQASNVFALTSNQNCKKNPDPCSPGLCRPDPEYCCASPWPKNGMPGAHGLLGFQADGGPIWRCYLGTNPEPKSAGASHESLLATGTAFCLLLGKYMKVLSQFSVAF